MIGFCAEFTTRKGRLRSTMVLRWWIRKWPSYQKRRFSSSTRPSLRSRCTATMISGTTNCTWTRRIRGPGCTRTPAAPSTWFRPMARARRRCRASPSGMILSWAPTQPWASILISWTWPQMTLLPLRFNTKSTISHRGKKCSRTYQRHFDFFRVNGTPRRKYGSHIYF